MWNKRIAEGGICGQISYKQTTLIVWMIQKHWDVEPETPQCHLWSHKGSFMNKKDAQLMETKGGGCRIPREGIFFLSTRYPSDTSSMNLVIQEEPWLRTIVPKQDWEMDRLIMARWHILPSMCAWLWALGESMSWFGDFYSSSSLGFYTVITLSSYLIR